MRHVDDFNYNYLNIDAAKHELLLCTTRQPTVNSNNKTSAAPPYLRNRSNARSGVSVTDVLMPRTVGTIKLQTQQQNKQRAPMH